MLMETIIAYFLAICLASFFSINLHNILVAHKPEKSTKAHAEIDWPSGLIVGLAAFGTFVYFLEAATYMFLVLTNLLSLTTFSTFSLPITLTLLADAMGLVLTAIGYITFPWSVIARGKYATSWEMRDSHKLVTWGPYRYVRHPSYLAYFFMFIGLFAIWPSWLTLIPLAAIPGYFPVTFREEKLLEKRFGSQYLDYQRKTGRFIPKLQNIYSHEDESSRRA